MRITLLVLVYLATAIIATAWEPVRLVPYPQKFRTFYSLDDVSVPKTLREDPAKLDVTNRCGYVWRATSEGLWKLDPRAAARDRSQYFAGQRYLPDNEVVALAPDQDCGIWARTKSGVSHIELRPMTLAAKATLFEERIALRHDRYGLVADSTLLKPGDTNSNQYSDSDNDGLWTSIYAAAECFRYSVTKSPEALKRAKHSIEAMLFLEEVAGRRGFPARSYIRKGDRMPHGGEWHWTADGQYFWKADTSSDEIVGHFFIFSIAYDLLPDKELKKRIAQTTGRIMDHILDHNYTLCDLDGKPTTWGWWSPEKLAQEPDERALNSLQLLSFLKTAGHITGNKRYEKEYQKAVTEFKYPDLMKGLNTYRTEMNYSDEELAMLPFYCLFQYEKDAKLLTSYRQALDE